MHSNDDKQTPKRKKIDDKLEFVSKELNHLAAILHAYAWGLSHR